MRRLQSMAARFLAPPLTSPGSRFELAQRLGRGHFLQRLHVVVGEAEMMTDLVDQQVPHQMRQILAGLAPVVDQRAAIEEDRFAVAANVAGPLPGRSDARLGGKEWVRTG